MSASFVLGECFQLFSWRMNELRVLVWGVKFPSLGLQEMVAEL